jgi:hypothetical protein
MTRCNEPIATVVAGAAYRNYSFILQVLELSDNKICYSVAGVLHHEKTSHAKNGMAVLFNGVHLI